MAAVGSVTGGVVHRQAGHGEVGRAVDRHELHGRVEHVEVRDGAVGQVVRVEELGLGLAAVRALAVPPLRAVAVEFVVAGAGDLDAGAGD